MFYSRPHQLSCFRAVRHLLTHAKLLFVAKTVSSMCFLDRFRHHLLGHFCLSPIKSSVNEFTSFIALSGMPPHVACVTYCLNILMLLHLSRRKTSGCSLDALPAFSSTLRVGCDLPSRPSVPQPLRIESILIPPAPFDLPPLWVSRAFWSRWTTLPAGSSRHC